MSAHRFNQEQKSAYGGFHKIGVPSHHPKLDHCTIETYGDLGIPPFQATPHVTTATTSA